MSWRDRLARAKDDPIGTNGTIGVGVFSAKLAPVGPIPTKTAKPDEARPSLAGADNGGPLPAAVSALEDFAAFYPSAVSAESADSLPLPGSSPRADEYNERAAIIQHDGNIPRAWAEGIARLDPDRAPGDVPLHRWQRFIDDVARFLDGGWATKAAAIGWGPLELFGCNRQRPFARIDHMGLCWLLDGNRLVDLDRDKAVIEFPNGARQVFYRTPLAVGGSGAGMGVG